RALRLRERRRGPGRPAAAKVLPTLGQARRRQRRRSPRRAAAPRRMVESPFVESSAAPSAGIVGAMPARPGWAEWGGRAGGGGRGGGGAECNGGSGHARQDQRQGRWPGPGHEPQRGAGAHTAVRAGTVERAEAVQRDCWRRGPASARPLTGARRAAGASPPVTWLDQPTSFATRSPMSSSRLVAPPPPSASANGLSPVKILDDALGAGLVLQHFCPLAESLDWELGQSYWQQRGSQAFSSDQVPFLVLNDGNVSMQAAEVFFASVHEADRAGRLPQDL